MKRKIFLALTMALSTAFLASCSACESCEGNTKVSFKDYFLKNAEYSVSKVDETLTYEVKHEGQNTYNGYTVNYTNGKYVTKLSKTPGAETYTLESKFTMDVEYVFNGVSSGKLTDSTESTVLFHSSKNSLKPISSEKVIISHSPWHNTPQEVSDCYELYAQRVETDYTNNQTSIWNLETENGAPTVRTFEFEDADKYAYLDNEQLLFALRCIKPTSSGKVQTYAPSANDIQTLKIAYGSSTTADFALSMNGNETQKYEIKYLPATMDIDAEKNGSTHTAWIAETDDLNNNTYRNLLLKYIVALPFSLGEFHYNLVSVSYSQE